MNTLEFNENIIKEDAASFYENIDNEIKRLETLQYEIIKYIADYKLTFGKYKDKTIAEVAYTDRQYYNWLKKKNILPFTLTFKMDWIISDIIKNKNEQAYIADLEKRKQEQGYVGRYII